MTESSETRKWLLRIKQKFKKGDKAPPTPVSTGDEEEVRDQAQKIEKTAKPAVLLPPAPESVRVPSHPLCFVPGGEYLASASADYAIRLWEWKAGTKPSPFRTLKAHVGEVRGVAISPDGQLLASASRDRTVRLWNLADHKSTEPVMTHILPEGAIAVAFSPDGKTLAAGSMDHAVCIWDVHSGEPSPKLEGHRGAVSSVAFSPCGKRLASGSWDETIRIWNISERTLLRELSGHTGPVLSVAFDPGHQRLASAGTSEIDKPVSIWDLDTGACLYSLSIPISLRRISSVSFSATGSRLALSLADHAVLIWNLKLDSVVKTVTEHGIWSIACNPGEISAKIFDTGKAVSHAPQASDLASQSRPSSSPESQAVSKPETGDKVYYPPPETDFNPTHISPTRKVSHYIGPGFSLNQPRTCYMCMGYIDYRAGSAEMCRCREK